MPARVPASAYRGLSSTKTSVAGRESDLGDDLVVRLLGRACGCLARWRRRRRRRAGTRSEPRPRPGPWKSMSSLLKIAVVMLAAARAAQEQVDGPGASDLDARVLEHRAHQVGVTVERRTPTYRLVGVAEPVVPLGQLPGQVPRRHSGSPPASKGPRPGMVRAGRAFEPLEVVGDLPRRLEEHHADVEQQSLGHADQPRRPPRRPEQGSRPAGQRRGRRSRPGLVGVSRNSWGVATPGKFRIPR